MPGIEFVRADTGIEHAPISSAIRAGDFLWLAGMTPIDAESGEIVGVGDLQAQARQVFVNMRHVLGKAGLGPTSVIRLTNYFATPLDMTVASAYWEVRREVFGDHHPASTGVQVAALMPAEAMIEIDAIAYAPNTTV